MNEFRCILNTKKFKPQSSISAHVKILDEALNEFDIDLFAAYITDWRQRIKSIDQILLTNEFETAYRALIKSRTDLVKVSKEFSFLSQNDLILLNKLKEVESKAKEIKLISEKVAS